MWTDALPSEPPGKSGVLQGNWFYKAEQHLPSPSQRGVCAVAELNVAPLRLSKQGSLPLNAHFSPVHPSGLAAPTSFSGLQRHFFQPILHVSLSASSHWAGRLHGLALSHRSRTVAVPGWEPMSASQTGEGTGRQRRTAGYDLVNKWESGPGWGTRLRESSGSGTGLTVQPL